MKVFRVVWAAALSGVLFIAFYKLFAHAWAARVMGAGWFALAGVLVAVRIAVAFAVMSGWMRHLTRGAALSGQGRYVEALEAFERAQKTAGPNPSVQMSLGDVNLHLWRLDRATQHFETAERRRPGSALHILMYPLAALSKALEGNVAGARASLQKAAERENAAAPSALLAEAVLHCRESRWTEAAAVLERRELLSLGGPLRALADALRAWCLAETTGERRPVDATAVYGEAGPDALRRWWPQLVDFLEPASSRSAAQS